MQTALDSTALMLAKEAATDTEDELKINASKFFKALFKREEAKDVDVKVTYTTSGGSNIKVEATASLDAQFVRVLGFDTFHLGASSTAKWGINRLRVALAHAGHFQPFADELRADLLRTMALLGCPSLGALDRSMINVPRGLIAE